MTGRAGQSCIDKSVAFKKMIKYFNLQITIEMFTRTKEFVAVQLLYYARYGVKLKEFFLQNWVNCEQIEFVSKLEKLVKNWLFFVVQTMP